MDDESDSSEEDDKKKKITKDQNMTATNTSSTAIADLQPSDCLLLPENEEEEEGMELSTRIIESSSSEESLTAEYPRGHKRKLVEWGLDMGTAPISKDNEDDDEMLPSVKFRRGEFVDGDLDIERKNREGDDSQDDDSDGGSIDAPDEVDDGEWNMMGAALEREFLSNN